MFFLKSIDQKAIGHYQKTIGLLMISGVVEIN